MRDSQPSGAETTKVVCFEDEESWGQLPTMTRPVSETSASKANLSTLEIDELVNEIFPKMAAVDKVG